MSTKKYKKIKPFNATLELECVKLFSKLIFSNKKQVSVVHNNKKKNYCINNNKKYKEDHLPLKLLLILGV